MVLRFLLLFSSINFVVNDFDFEASVILGRYSTVRSRIGVQQALFSSDNFTFAFRQYRKHHLPYKRFALFQ
jgi:hypothetical protein